MGERGCDADLENILCDVCLTEVECYSDRLMFFKIIVNAVDVELV